MRGSRRSKDGVGAVNAAAARCGAAAARAGALMRRDGGEALAARLWHHICAVRPRPTPMTSPPRAPSPSADPAPSGARRTLLFAVAMSPFLALLALLFWSQIGSGNAPGGLLEHNEPGDVAVAMRPAPAISGDAELTGEAVDLGALRGSVVVVDFWSSWCAACRAEAADLAAVYAEYSGKPVEFVGIAIWDTPGDVARHIERFGVAYPNLIDEVGSTAVAYGVRGVPEKFFLDADGRIARKIIGPMTAERLRAVLDALLPA